MSEKLYQRQLRRLFPNAPESFIKANSIDYHDPRSAGESKSVDRKEVRQAPRSEAVGKTHRLVACDIEFFAQHGQVLDRDNKDNVRKCIWDALVNLGFERDDKKFKGKVNQRMVSDNPYI